MLKKIMLNSWNANIKSKTWDILAIKHEHSRNIPLCSGNIVLVIYDRRLAITKMCPCSPY